MPSISDDPDAFFLTWLQKRQGLGQMIYATGRVETTRGKYLPLEQAPDLAAYLVGQKGHIYGSRLQFENGLTWVLCYDFDEKQPAYDRRAWVLLRKMARRGVCAVYWRRRPRRGHLEVYFDAPVDPQAARAFLEQICPSLHQVAECYPVRNTALSWPLWQRIGDQITECEMLVCYPWQADQVLSSPGIDRDRRGLALLLTYAVTPASLIPPVPEKPERNAKATEERDQAATRGCLLEKDRDILPIVLAEFHTAHSWDEIANLCGGWDHGYFRAVWRGDRTASVKVDRDERYCCDYGNHGSFPKKLDKLGVWCLAQGLDQKAELSKQCKEYRARFEASAFQPDYSNLKDVQMKPASFSAKHEKISREAPTNVSSQSTQLFPVEVPGCNPKTRSVDLQFNTFMGPYPPPPARLSYCCGSLAWTWNEQLERYMCGSCKK